MFYYYQRFCFWAGASQFGLMPEGSGELALLWAGTEYDATKEFQRKWGVSLAGQYGSHDVPEKNADLITLDPVAVPFIGMTIINDRCFL